MAFIETIAPAAAEGEVRAMYERQQQKYGHVPNYAKVFGHRPEVMTRWAALQSEIRRRVDPRRFELVSFTVAHALGNSACSLAHGELLTQYIDARDVSAIATGELADSALCANDRAMVRFARKVARDASAITYCDVAELTRLGFSDVEVFDIVAIVAARAFFTKLLDGLGVLPDNRFGHLDEELRRVLTVGRPIDCLEPERLPP
jgi:uncharacterized peroxidase-related enzyme